jgi:16S rRNA (cytidine1402-2'-O)-methyltransferase
MGNRPAVVARELTKLHEEFLRGTAQEIREELAARPSVKGEFTLLLGKPDETFVTGDAPVEEAVREAESLGLSRMDAIKHVAKQRGLNKRDVYRKLTE